MHAASVLLPVILVMCFSSSKTFPIQTNDCNITSSAQLPSPSHRPKRQAFDKSECDKRRVADRSKLAEIMDWFRSDIAAIAVPLVAAVVICLILACFITFCWRQGDSCCAKLWCCCNYCQKEKKESDPDIYRDPYDVSAYRSPESPGRPHAGGNKTQQQETSRGWCAFLCCCCCCCKRRQKAQEAGGRRERDTGAVGGASSAESLSSSSSVASVNFDALPLSSRGPEAPKIVEPVGNIEAVEESASDSDATGDD